MQIASVSERAMPAELASVCVPPSVCVYDAASLVCKDSPSSLHTTCIRTHPLTLLVVLSTSLLLIAVLEMDESGTNGGAPPSRAPFKPFHGLPAQAAAQPHGVKTPQTQSHRRSSSWDAQQNGSAQVVRSPPRNITGSPVRASSVRVPPRPHHCSTPTPTCAAVCPPLPRFRSRKRTLLLCVVRSWISFIS